VDQTGIFMARRHSLSNLARGFDASLRSALGAITGLIILLGLDGIDNYSIFGASLVASGVVSYALLEPLRTRISGRLDPKEPPKVFSGIHRLQLFIRLMCVAAIAVAADELFVRGMQSLESTSQIFSYHDVVHFGPFVVPILIGVFLILASITLSWMLGDELVHQSRLAIISLLGACSAALVSSVYFIFRARSPTSVFAILDLPADAENRLVAAHVALTAMLGMAGGIVIARINPAMRRFEWIALVLLVVTLAWSFAVFLAFDSLYEGLLEWKVFRCHVVVVFGWIVGLFAGPLGRSDSARTAS
jgi:hypothetical protein